MRCQSKKPLNQSIIRNNVFKKWVICVRLQATVDTVGQRIDNEKSICGLTDTDVNPPVMDKTSERKPK